MGMTDEQLISNRDTIIKLWELVQRPGVDDLVGYLIDTDFFLAPCSTRYHLNVRGGLALHSLNVFSILSRKIRDWQLPVSKDSVIVTALGHDLCKINFYELGSRNVKKDNKWITESVYKINDGFPYGHGEKSVTILQDYIKLSVEEKLAIRWHMGLAGATYAETQAYNLANQRFPLVTLLHTADLESTYLLEKDIFDEGIKQ